MNESETCSIRKDLIRNECICEKIEMTPDEDKKRESDLMCFSFVQRSSMIALVRRNDLIQGEDAIRARGR